MTSDDWSALIAVLCVLAAFALGGWMNGLDAKERRRG